MGEPNAAMLRKSQDKKERWTNCGPKVLPGTEEAAGEKIANVEKDPQMLPHRVLSKFKQKTMS